MKSSGAELRRRCCIPRTWEPDWRLDLAPEGPDEPQVRKLYESQTPEERTPWEELEDWKKDSWRREYRA